MRDSCMRFCSPRRGRGRRGPDRQREGQTGRQGKRRRQLGRKGRLGATWQLRRGFWAPTAPWKADRQIIPHGTALLASSVQSNPHPLSRGRWQRRDGEPTGAPSGDAEDKEPNPPVCRACSHERVSLRLCVRVCGPQVSVYEHVCICMCMCVCAHVHVLGGLLDRSLRAVLWPSGPHLSCWAYPVGGGVLWDWRGAPGPSCGLRGEVTPGSCQHPPGTGEKLQPRLPAGMPGGWPHPLALAQAQPEFRS